MVVVSTLNTPLIDLILSGLFFLPNVSDGNLRMPRGLCFSGEPMVGEPGGVRLVCVLLFLRKREERIRELVFRVGEARTEAGLPLGVDGRLAGCTGSCLEKFVGREKRLLLEIT